MNRAVIISLIAHVLVFLAMIIGLPHLKSERPLPPSISVELATIADITQANKPPVKAPLPKEEQPPAKTKKAVPKPNPVKEPPKLTPEEKPKPETKPKEAEEKPEVDPLAKPKPDKKPEKKPDKKPKAEPKQTAEFSSLLKNLTTEKEQIKSDIGELTKKVAAQAPSPDTPNLGEQLTISDIDALRQQLAGCWNVFAGAAEAHDLAVDIRVIVNADRTVQRASIMDESRYNSDDRYRAAAESALRAVRDPRCSPLNLPPEKYNLWHDMIVNFDPREML